MTKVFKTFGLGSDIRTFTKNNMSIAINKMENEVHAQVQSLRMISPIEQHQLRRTFDNLAGVSRDERMINQLEIQKRIAIQEYIKE